MITYVWNILKLDCAPSENGLTNVVKTIHWKLTAIDDNGVAASISNSYPLPNPNPEDFNDYSSLTEEMVISWLENSLDAGYLKDNLSNQILSQYNPPITSLPLPWVKEELIIPELPIDMSNEPEENTDTNYVEETLSDQI